MTKLAVIHLSDIHIHGESDSCLDRASDLASACFEIAREADACLIALTGDIAYAGKEAQYKVAKTKLIEPICQLIEKETSRPVYIAIVPGNHDCVLIPKDDVRETLIQAVIEDPSKAENESIIEACTKAQENFYNFYNEIISPKPHAYSKIFFQQEFTIGQKTIRVSSLNAAWMSVMKEQQGKLIYPINKFEAPLAKQAFIHLALIHHPFNWQTQESYQHLRKRLRLSCTAILSGHEHIGNAGKIEDQLTGSSIFLEAAALQPHESTSEAGFSAYLFDLDEKKVVSQSFELMHSNVRAIDSVTYSWNDDTFIHGALDITDDFLKKLNDPGGNFTHSAKDKLTLEDVFVWPDLKDWENEDINKQKGRSSQQLLAKIKSGEDTLIYGSDKSGKTTLLFWYFKELIAQGYAPVYLSLSDTSISNSRDAQKKITQAIEAQYKNSNAITILPREKKILLLDDMDRIKSGLRTLHKVLEYAERNYCATCMTAGAGFEITNLASNEASAAISKFKTHDIMKFGFKLRHQLIKRWCSLSPISTKPELDQKIDEIESIVNSVIGKQLVPEYPIYLLILLQSSEQHRHGEIQNSGLSFYYQYLITKSLGEVGVKPKELDEHFNYLSMLAWDYRVKEIAEMEKTDLEVFNRNFSMRFVSVDLSERLNLLTRARLLSKHRESFSFSYPYVYYFFLGKYLSKTIDAQETRQWIEESCNKLYLKDRAHAIMFLTHHTENKWVIGLICRVLQECFSDKKPIELNGDTSFLNDLVEKSAQLTLSAPDVDHNQTEMREIRDSDSDIDHDDELTISDALSIASKWNLLHKTAEILGLILKNYYGSLERPEKHEMIREVFDAPLRALRLLLEEIAGDMPSFVNELKLQELSQNRNMTSEEAERKVKQRVFNILGWVATGVVASAGNFISSDKLREDISTVVSNNPTNAYHLIEAASRLLRPGPLPLEHVKALASRLESNHYAFGVLQSLGLFHMYMFHTDEPQKQTLCSALKISFEKAKEIGVKKSERLLK